MKQNNWIARLGKAAFVYMLTVMGGFAFAQATDFGTLSKAPDPGADESMRVFVSILGNFAQNPFSQLGGPTTLMGGLFLVFNSCIFTIGFVWALYRIVGGIAATANDGEVLGRNMSTIWFPIRMVVGITGMIPVFGGFTLNQAVMMFLTIIGINIGNQMLLGAVNDTANMKAMVSLEGFTPSSQNQLKSAARDMFKGNVCLISEQQEKVKIVSAGGRLSAAETPNLQISMDGNRLMFGTPSHVSQCGQIVITGEIMGGGRGGSFAPLSFRVATVDYDAISAAAVSAYKLSLTRLNARIAVLANRWMIDYKAALASGAETPPVDVQQIEQMVALTQKEIASTVQGKINGTGLTEAAQKNIKALGWFGLGAWYSTFAEANAAIADATKGPSVSSVGPSYAGVASETISIMSSFTRSYDASKALIEQSTAKSGSQTLLDSAIRDSCGTPTGAGGGIGGAIGRGVDATLGTATGNCSLGQSIVSAAIRATAVGSGGGGDGAGSLGFDSTGLLNPIIMMKNIGDYVMSFSSTIIIGSAVSEIIPTGWVGKVAGVAATAANAVTKDDKGEGVVDRAMAWMQTIAFFTLVVGAAMALYIPMVPFIHWMGAIIAYVASMIEGLAGAVLHAMSHIDGDGDGMGQRTSHGYLFYINALIRPALMIIGFFAASSVMIALGTLQAKLFLPAMAGVQGNSITGLMSIGGLLLIFFVMNWTLISSCFNLIYVITDQVIGFLGNAINSQLGRDTEDKVNNMFMMAARVGPQALGSQESKMADIARAKSAGAKPAPGIRGGRGD